MQSINLAQVIEHFNFRVLTENIDMTEKLITRPDINRPALQLTGFYDYFDKDRIQLIGKVEIAYLESIPASERNERLKRLSSSGIPCAIFCRGATPYPEMIEYGEQNGVPVLQYEHSTTELMGEMIRWLRVQIAERITIHGVLVDIYGEGVLIMGESGIGKSETALELIQRGHRLVADDVVEIKRASQQTLIGSCPEVIRYLIELRGIGIIDVRQLFGVQSIKMTQSVDLVIKLVAWSNDMEYERLGLHDEYIDILGNKIVCHNIPIRPGRNIAIICESAAINHRQKKMGYNAAAELTQRLSANMQKK